MLIGINNLSVRNKTKLYKCLEAVADTAHKTVSLFKKFGNLIFNALVTEECGNEFTRTVRLITAREATGNKDNLRIRNSLTKLLNAS